MLGLNHLQEVIGFTADNMALAHIKLKKDGGNYSFVTYMSSKKVPRIQIIFYFDYKEFAGVKFTWRSMGGLPKSDKEIDKLRLMVEAVIARIYGLLFRGGS